MITRESSGYKYLLTGAFSVLLAVGYAQEEEKQDPVTIDSIDVVRDYRPMLEDAVKIRRSPDMGIDRQALQDELHWIVADAYFVKGNFRKPYYGKLLERHREAAPSNINNYRIGYMAYENGEYERAATILGDLGQSDAFYQGSMIALGNISLKAGDKQGARDAFAKASALDFDHALKLDGLFNYTKILFELDSPRVALDIARQYVLQGPVDTTVRAGEKETPETLLAEILLGTSNFEAAVNMLELYRNRDKEADKIYQKVAYYRGLEFYNERAFENSISLFMRSEEFPIDPRFAALAMYWKGEAMYEVRKYREAVEAFSRFLQMPAAPETDVYVYANYALAYAAFRSNNFTTAAKYFERFLSTGSGSMEENIRYDAIARLGDSYLSLRNYGRANQYYDELINGGAPNQDYAFFQRGIIQGLEGDNETKMNTLHSVIEQFPNSNYADDVAFEIPYTYFVMGDYDTAIEGLQQMIEQYPRSSYTARALMTIGLVQYNKEDNEAAMATFDKVVKEHSTTVEAGQALRAIENIYLDSADASGYVSYATNSDLGDLTGAERDNLTFQVAQTLFARGQYQAAVEAVNAYFDKFPNPAQEKHARYIRGVSLYRSGHATEALHDLNIILNDWTSPYTEKTLLAAADLYLGLEQYNEAIVHLKKLEITSEYGASYGYAISNLLVCYYEIGDTEQALKYIELTKAYDGSSEEDIARAHLYTGYVLLNEGDSAKAAEEMNLAALKSHTVVGAEAQYNVAHLRYKTLHFDQAIESAFDVINDWSSYDYWVAKSFILLADAYASKGDKLQAKSTLESVIENYEGEDDIIPAAEERLQMFNNK
ncbi:tetratricopeptide repeat protein [Parapedobacter sp. 10938]|uniref:tetratricopeptide repeat protein n=1 Tax=Parapedobacter flavus TaxID=3110225 RepID=UPI002DBB34E4|nr:tetratricopeptide repeat protein [Parapedobacter sp. 10938]MEC3879016.1 tetratricopeptide repeat protein [Parapedobacter sp. 10938]